MLKRLLPAKWRSGGSWFIPMCLQIHLLQESSWLPALHLLPTLGQAQSAHSGCAEMAGQTPIHLLCWSPSMGLFHPKKTKDLSASRLTCLMQPCNSSHPHPLRLEPRLPVSTLHLASNRLVHRTERHPKMAGGSVSACRGRHQGQIATGKREEKGMQEAEEK